MDEGVTQVGSKPAGGWFGRQAESMDRRRYVALLAVMVLISAALMGLLVAWGYGFFAVSVLLMPVKLLLMVPLAVLRLRYLRHSGWGAGWLFMPIFGDLFLIVWAIMGLGKRKALTCGLVGAVLYVAVFGIAQIVGEEIWWASFQPEFGLAELGCDALLRQQLLALPLATAHADNANAVAAGIRAQWPSECGHHAWRPPEIVQVNRGPYGSVDVYFSPREGGVRWVYLSERGEWYEGVGDGGLVPSAVRW